MLSTSKLATISLLNEGEIKMDLCVVMDKTEGIELGCILALQS